MKYIISESQYKTSMIEIFKTIWKSQIEDGEDPKVDDSSLKLFGLKQWSKEYKEVLLPALREFLGKRVVEQLLEESFRKQYNTEDYPELPTGTYKFTFYIEIENIDFENSEVDYSLKHVDGTVDIGEGDQEIVDVMNGYHGFEIEYEVRSIVEEILNNEVGPKIGFEFKQA